MRILHIGKYYPPYAGGMENFLADLVQAQINQGLEVAVLVHSHGCDTPIQNVYRVPSYGRLLYAPISPAFPFWLQRIIRDYKPDVLHLHAPNTSLFWLLAQPAAQRIAWVLHWHSDVVLDNKLALAYKFYRPFEQRLLAKTKIIIATSPPYLAASTALRAWQDKAKIIPLGIAFDRLADADADSLAWASQQWQNKLYRVLHVGRLTHYKGQKFLIQALARLPQAQLLIVGRGELQSELEQLIITHGLQSRVKLLGFCDDRQLRALFSSCELFCLPSIARSEAFGVVLMEAMRYAKPIIATNVIGSGMAWVVEHERTGLLVSPKQVDALVQAIEFFANNSELGYSYGQAGRAKFVQQFDIQQVAHSCQQVYQSIFNP